MKIALFGYGKMGKAIHRLALAQGMQVPVIISPSDPAATARKVDPKLLKEVDVCIDFSIGEAVLGNAKAAMQAQKPLVIGTTNWHDQFEILCKQMQDCKKEEAIGIIHGANFAIGTQLFYQIVRYAAKRMQGFGYDVGGLDWHHAHKADSPSGTAREITKILLEETPGKKRADFDRQEGVLPEDHLPFATLRCGYAPGLHVVFFDGPHDTIELRHTSRSREGLASGALVAAQWIIGKKGLYTIAEMLDEKALPEEKHSAPGR